MENLERLVEELRSLPDELAWVEFKHNNYDPQMIGEDISALANSAALYDKNCAYMIWGIHDETHDIVGTSYDLQSLKKGNQELENWLRTQLSANAEIEFHKVVMNNLSVGVLIIYKAVTHTVSFKGIDYIRVGSYTKKLSDHPTLESDLWGKLRSFRFEDQPAKENLSLEEALQYLVYTRYFELKELPVPTDMAGIGHYMLEEGIIVRQDNGLYAITNMGAVLFAKSLAEFDRLSRKAVRIIQYQGRNKLSIQREELITGGYVTEFENIIRIMSAFTPASLEIDPESGLRTQKQGYPDIALREIIANALIHQDYSVSGTGPLIEIFDNRVEFTNSGIPLVDIYRIIDNPPKSRNEKLAALARKLRICEELGTGWDKIIIACELYQLPAPKIELYEESTKVTLFMYIPFANLSPDEKMWACYLHACIQYVQNEQLTNSSLRHRFALPETASANISRLIKEAIVQKRIKPLDPDTAPRYMKYIPIWA